MITTAAIDATCQIQGKIYLFTVDGVCREAHQDNLDFGLAMKSLSKDKLKEIIGKQDVASIISVMESQVCHCKGISVICDLVSSGSGLIQ